MDAIADVPLSGHEAISGEFTGCPMTVFKKEGVTRAGHVDTSKRAEWNAIKAAGDPNSALEYDTTGNRASYPGGADGKAILCVARKGSIEHYFVSKSRLVYGKPTMTHLGTMQAKQRGGLHRSSRPRSLIAAEGAHGAYARRKFD